MGDPDFKAIVQLLFEVADVCPITLSPDFGGNSMTISFPGNHVHIGTPGDRPLEVVAQELRDTLEFLKGSASAENYLKQWYEEQKALIAHDCRRTFDGKEKSEVPRD